MIGKNAQQRFQFERPVSCKRRAVTQKPGTNVAKDQIMLRFVPDNKKFAITQ